MGTKIFCAFWRNFLRGIVLIQKTPRLCRNFFLRRTSHYMSICKANSVNIKNGHCIGSFIIYVRGLFFHGGQNLFAGGRGGQNFYAFKDNPVNKLLIDRICVIIRIRPLITDTHTQTPYTTQSMHHPAVTTAVWCPPYTSRHWGMLLT